MSESESTRKDFPDWENLYKLAAMNPIVGYIRYSNTSNNAFRILI